MSRGTTSRSGSQIRGARESFGNDSGFQIQNERGCDKEQQRQDRTSKHPTLECQTVQLSGSVQQPQLVQTESLLDTMVLPDFLQLVADLTHGAGVLLLIKLAVQRQTEGRKDTTCRPATGKLISQTPILILLILHFNLCKLCR